MYRGLLTSNPETTIRPSLRDQCDEAIRANPQEPKFRPPTLDILSNLAFPVDHYGYQCARVRLPRLQAVSDNVLNHLTGELRLCSVII